MKFVKPIENDKAVENSKRKNPRNSDAKTIRPVGRTRREIWKNRRQKFMTRLSDKSQRNATIRRLLHFNLQKELKGLFEGIYNAIPQMFRILNKWPSTVVFVFLVLYSFVYFFHFRTADIAQKKSHVPEVDRTPIEPPPYVIAIVGPPKVGKSLLLKCLIKHYCRQTLSDIKGPVTVIAGTTIVKFELQYAPYELALTIYNNVDLWCQQLIS